MGIKFLAGLALAVALAAPAASQAAVFTFKWGGATSGRVAVTYVPDPNTSAVLDSSPNIHDPLGSYIITGVSGTFTDPAAGIVNATITGLEALNPVTPEPTNLLAPSRFSLLAIANGVDNGDGHPSLGFHYDNIFYPGGSPATASDYPFSGGVFDIYGLAFTLDNGNAVNFWSNGAQPGIGLNYGVAVTDRIDVLDYVGGISI